MALISPLPGVEPVSANAEEAGPFRQEVTISAGGDHNCGIQSDGTLICWGRNDSGQGAMPESGTFRQVSSGDKHNCAIQSDGLLYCWGNDDFNQVTDMPAGTFR